MILKLLQAEMQNIFNTIIVIWVVAFSTAKRYSLMFKLEHNMAFAIIYIPY